MAHPLEISFGLSASEILDAAMYGNNRCVWDLKGKVNEVKFRRILETLRRRGVIAAYRPSTGDAEPDFYVDLPHRKNVRIEVKGVRNIPYADGSPRVEVQKHRDSGVVGGRKYSVDYFDLLAVCLDTQRGEFVYARPQDLAADPTFAGKINANQRIGGSAWHASLEAILKTLDTIR